MIEIITSIIVLLLIICALFMIFRVVFISITRELFWIDALISWFGIFSIIGLAVLTLLSYVIIMYP